MKGMVAWLWRFGGVPTGLLAGLAALLLVAAAEPSKDFNVVLPYEQAIFPDGRAGLIRGNALEGADLDRVVADIDGRAVQLRWSGRAFDASLPPLAPGAHALRMGIVHQGGVRREFVVPVITGPFVARGEWIDNAISVQLALEDIDSRGTRTGDLASALSRSFMARVPPGPLGELTACPVTIRASRDASWFVLGGVAAFERGSIAFTIPLRFRRPDRQHVTIARAGRIRATPDDRALQVGRDRGRTGGGGLGMLGGAVLLGPVGLVLGLLLGQSMGEGVGEDEVRWRARTQVERLVDEFLPRVSEALVLPEEISLGSRVPEAKLLLRFHAPPRFVDGRGLVVRIDVMVESAAGGLFRDDKTGPQNATAKLPGPLAFPDSDQLFEGSESGVTASPAFVAALADAYAVGGGAERDLGQLSWENGRARRVGPLEIRGTHLAAPSLLTAGGPPGALAWAIPDLALATNLPHDVRVFATGSLTAHLAADGRSVLARPAIQQLYASCRERSGTGWTFLPCLSDATSAFPDAPARLTRALPEITLFADVLGPLADAPLRSGTGLSVSIRPTRVELGDRAGAPRAALAASVSFAVP